MDYQLILDYVIGYGNCTKSYVRDVLAKHKGKPVNVLISSYGGLLSDGLDIMQQFRDHGDVTVYISGFTASAATVAAMGAKKVVMGKYSMFLIHKCSNYIDAWGSYNADQLQQLIDELVANKEQNDKIDVVLANLYADKCKKSVEDMKTILQEGKWLNAEEAKNIGFIDEISSFDEKINLTGDERRRIMNLGLPTEGLPAEDNPSWFTALFERLKAFSKASLPDNGEKLNNSTTMKKKFNSLGKVLNKEEFATADDGAVTMTGEEMQAVEDHVASLENDINERDTTIAQRDERITELEAQIENLQKQPGDDTKDVLPVEDSLKVAEESKKMYDNIKDI